MSASAPPTTYLLDDFRAGDGTAAIGTQWQGLTDRVMGGLSEMQAGVISTDRGPALQMRGEVRLENSGGFIQVRLPLATAGGAFDAGGWSGFALAVRGTPGAYYLHVRSADTRQPWQHYRAPLPVQAAWQRVVVPFTAFEPQRLERPLDVRRLHAVAVVAYGEAFRACLEVGRLELTTEAPA